MTTASPAPVPDLRIGSLLSRSWRAFRTRSGLLMGYLALYALVFGGLGFLIDRFRAAAMPRPGLHDATLILGAQLVLSSLGFLFATGLVYVAMRVWAGDDARFGMFFVFLRKPWRLLGLYLMLWLGNVVFILLLVGLGALCAVFLGRWAAVLPAAVLCVPYAYAVLAMGPALVVLLETDLGIPAALRLGWNLVQGRRWRILLVFLFSSLLAAAGLLGLVIGILVTAPLAQLMLVGAYEELVQAYIRKLQVQALA